MAYTYEEAVEKCKETKSIIVGKVQLTTGETQVALIVPVIKSDSEGEKLGTVSLGFSLKDAADLAKKLDLVVSAPGTGWVVPEEDLVKDRCKDCNKTCDHDKE
jgi:ATP-dependent DNA ligase